MDLKRLYQAIKELRAELDRVNLAIQRIEAIAEAVNEEQQTSSDPVQKVQPDNKPAGDED